VAALPRGMPPAVVVTLVRHAECVANVAGVLPGDDDPELTARGTAQVRRLEERLRGDRFDLVVSSPLRRTRATAAAIGAPRVDPRWREFDFGHWKGRSPEEIEERSPGRFRAFAAGIEDAVSGGERMSRFTGRVAEGWRAIVDELRPRGRAVVVTHAAPIMTILGRVLGLADPYRCCALVGNASLTTVAEEEDGRRRLLSFNDRLHLPEPDAGTTSVYLFRHGRTEANVAGRWQGRTDTPLDEVGERQARRLARVAPALDVLYTSPLARARHTARLLAAEQGLSVEVVEELSEIDFGSWEDRTATEVRARDPEAFAAVYRDDRDLPRGGSGETFAAAGARLAAAIEELVAAHPGERIGVVGHGGVVRAYLCRLLGIPFAGRGRIGIMANAAMSRFDFGADGPRLVTWNGDPRFGA